MSEKIGNPREPRPALLDRAGELGIHQVLDRRGVPNGSLPGEGIAGVLVGSKQTEEYVSH